MCHKNLKNRVDVGDDFCGGGNGDVEYNDVGDYKGHRGDCINNDNDIVNDESDGNYADASDDGGDNFLPLLKYTKILNSV